MLEPQKSEKLSYATNFLKNKKYQIVCLMNVLIDPLTWLPYYLQNYLPVEKLKEKISNKFSYNHEYSHYKVADS